MIGMIEILPSSEQNNPLLIAYCISILGEDAMLERLRKGTRIACFLYSNTSVSIKVQERVVPALKCSEQVPH
jgi:hypothetical protein